MLTQAKVFDPVLTRNVNGSKKFSFKLYKKYIDNITGEEIFNPFYDWLINERKVKLHHKNKWYDFIIKDIQEDSSNYVCTYQLEDAFVQELSKNGFNIVLDEELMNNSGTAKELADSVLTDNTDWTVVSETFIQTTEESLVWLSFQGKIDVQLIKDQTDSGLIFEATSIGEDNETNKVLAFYSSCSNKPHRFQFIYVANNGYVVDENRIITNKNCQYFIEPNKYEVKGDYGFFIPNVFDSTTESENNKAGVVISEEYRGRRYVFTHQSRYIPQLERYVNEYTKTSTDETGTTTDMYYGFQETEYISPAFVLDVMTNGDCKSVTGWTGTGIGENSSKASVECIAGYFNENDKFISANVTEESTKLNTLINYSEPWIRVDFSKGGVVLNSGPFDNRELIGRMRGTWVVDYDIRDTEGNKIILKSKTNEDGSIGHDGPLIFELGEYEYDEINDCYKKKDESWGGDKGKNYGFSVTSDYSIIKYYEEQISLTEDGEEKIEYICNDNGKIFPTFTIGSLRYSEEEFKKYSQVRLCIKANSEFTTTNPTIYYIKSIKFFRAYYDNDNVLIQPGVLANQNAIETRYNYFKAGEVDSINSIEQLRFEHSTSELSYNTYVPYYGADGAVAEKIRSVKAKESNCFNILQSIAETFECWMDLVIGRNDDGSIISKTVQLKKYAGVDNYAGFRYGVNLKNMKRTFASKQIVTKLIVKDNSNEFANNGFCSITRASANPTGENYIYDFSYYFNNEIMKASDFINTVYVINGASGDDILSTEGGTSVTNTNTETTWNINGYFLRIRDLNKKIDETNTELLNLSKDILQYQADLEVAVNGYEASKSSIEQVLEECKKITGYNIEGIDESAILSKNIEKFAREYLIYKAANDKYKKQKKVCQNRLDLIQVQYNELQTQIENYVEYKNKLNKKFFSTYSRFIQEGAWINEEYVDDEKYYIDALSTMYNSCYPKAAYSIDVTEVSSLPGYEFFTYELGDETFVEDYDFFGSNLRVPVVLTEIAEHLDDESKNTIKVQNFKNQFQDLFQKITATVQQTQYSTGSYDKAVALAEATQERKRDFLNEALKGSAKKLSVAGQQDVTWGIDGITVKSIDAPCNAIRMVGGAILLSKPDDNGQQKWVTAVTADGISASLITAGIINANEISIMNGNEATFRWDSHGINAFDYVKDTTGTIVSGINTHKFVRLDKHGLYGINNDGVEDIDNDGVDGANWVPEDLDDILGKASFALTWDGLQVVREYYRQTDGEDGTETMNRKVSLHIGKNGPDIFTIHHFYYQGVPGGITEINENIFSISNEGDLSIKGKVEATSGKIGGWDLTQNALYGMSSIKTGDKTTKYYTGIRVYNSLTTDEIAFYAGAPDNSVKNAKFSVTYSGKVEASNLHVKGGEISIGTKKSDSTKANFKVDENGDVTINGGSISIGEDEDKKPNFYVDTSGNVTMKGSITLGGSITWETGTSPTQAIYNRTSGPKPTDNWKYNDIPDNYPATNYSGWHKIFDSTNDKYASYTYDGGKTWTNAIKIVGENGKNGIDGSDAVVTRGNIIAALEESKSKGDGIYPIGDLIAINATAIRTGYLGFKTSENATSDIGWIDPFLANNDNIAASDLKKQYLKINNFSLSQYGLCIGNELYNFEGAGEGIFIGQKNALTATIPTYGIIIKDTGGNKAIFSASTDGDSVYATNLTVRGDDAVNGTDRVTIGTNIILYGGDIEFQ